MHISSKGPQLSCSKEAIMSTSPQRQPSALDPVKLILVKRPS